MQTAKFTPGMIYLVKNQFEEKIGLQTTQHNYIVLGTIMNGRNSGFQMVQAMNITSNPKNEEINGKVVPVLLSNGAISWILPYNIHSITFSDIEKGKFHGIIEDSEYCTVKRFVQMLIDLYNDELGLGFVDHDVIMKEYREYYDWFFEAHAGLKQYRDLTSDEKKEVKAPSLFNGKTVIYKDSSKELLKPKKYREIDTMSGEQIIPPELDPETEKSGPEYETVYSSSDEPGKALSTQIIIPEGFNIKKNPPKRGKYKDISEMPEADRKAIQSFTEYPCYTKDWSDNELLLFIMACDTYGASGISEVSTRWTTHQSVRYTYRSIKNQVSKRKLVLN